MPSPLVEPQAVGDVLQVIELPRMMIEPVLVVAHQHALAVLHHETGAGGGRPARKETADNRMRYCFMGRAFRQVAAKAPDHGCERRDGDRRDQETGGIVADIRAAYNLILGLTDAFQAPFAKSLGQM